MFLLKLLKGKRVGSYSHNVSSADLRQKHLDTLESVMIAAMNTATLNAKTFGLIYPVIELLRLGTEGQVIRMSKDPAFLFYSADFLIGVSFMSMEARGQYITLLCLQHQKGHMSIEDMELSVGTIDKSVMCHFEQDEDGLYYNARIEDEITKRKAFSESRRQNRSRPNKNISYESHMRNICNTQVTHMENENINVNENVNRDNKIGVKGEEKKRHKYGEYQNVLLSDDDISKLKAEFPADWEKRIEKLSSYMASKGTSYKNHLATIRNWAKRDKDKGYAGYCHDENEPPLPF